jgi:hypothetical protein
VGLSNDSLKDGESGDDMPSMSVLFEFLDDLLSEAGPRPFGKWTKAHQDLSAVFALGMMLSVIVLLIVLQS